MASAASDAASDNQEEADENRFHEKLIALKNDPAHFFFYFSILQMYCKRRYVVATFYRSKYRFKLDLGQKRLFTD